MYVLAADSRKKRQEKISVILGTNSSHGPAVREGGKQSDTPFVGRPRLFDLVLDPTSIHDSCTFARGINHWTMAAQHTSRPRPGSRFCLINFLSGSTPPKSAKRKRLPSSPSKKKSSSRRGTFFFTFFKTSFWPFLHDVRSQNFFLFFSMPGRPIRL